MKKTLLLSITVSSCLSAQVGMQPFFTGQSNAISYCAGVGYPAAPKGTPAVWYSGDCITFPSSVCTTPANGTTITTWQDRSGNARDASISGGTATFNTNQLNGKPAVTLSGSTSGTIGGTAIPSNDAHTVFLVAQWPSLSGGTSETLLASTFTGFQYRISGFNQNVLSNGNANIATGTTTLSSATWYSLNATQCDTGSCSPTVGFNVNQAVDTPGTITNSNVVSPTVLFHNQVNGDEYFNGTTTEFFYYNSQLSAADIVYDTCYLYGKYAR